MYQGLDLINIFMTGSSSKGYLFLQVYFWLLTLCCGDLYELIPPPYIYWVSSLFITNVFLRHIFTG